ncbi:hypothetical protein OIU76_026538, partial [Salix suchowensis]
MGFLVTTLIFVVVGIIASLCTRICCNRGPSANFPQFKLCIHKDDCMHQVNQAPPNIGFDSNSVLLDD